MIKYYVAIIVVLALLLGGVAVYASDIDEANFYGTIIVSNNSTVATGVSVNVTGLHSTNLIAAGFLNNTGNNTSVQYSGADITFMPGYGSNPWVIWAGDLAANSITNDILYMKNVSGGLIYYFPGNGGMTVADNSTLEWGASGNISIDAMFNPASTTPVMIKTNALKIAGDGAGNAVAYAYNGTTTTSTFRPNAAGDLTGLTPSAGANYACSGDDSDSTYVSTTSASYVGDLYNEPNHTTENGQIDSVTVYFRIVHPSGVQATYATPQWKIGGASYNGTEQTTTSTSYVNKTQVYTLSPATSLPWTWAELDGAQLGIWLKSAGGETARCADIWYVVSQPTKWLTISGISASQHTFKLGLSSGTLSFQVDSGTANTTSMSGNITNNANVWQIGDDDSTPYIASVKMGVGASVATSLAWEYGTVFHDSIGNNNATPTFRTTSSDADVSATLTLFLPVTEPKAPAFVVGQGPDFLSDNITATGNFTSGNSTLNYPGKSVIDAVAAAGGVPYQIPSTFIGTFSIIILSMATSFFMKQYSAQSLFVKSAVYTVGYGVLVALHIYDWWMLMFFFIFEQAIWFAAKERSQ